MFDEEVLITAAFVQLMGVVVQYLTWLSFFQLIHKCIPPIMDIKLNKILIFFFRKINLFHKNIKIYKIFQNQIHLLITCPICPDT